MGAVAARELLDRVVAEKAGIANPRLSSWRDESRRGECRVLRGLDNANTTGPQFWTEWKDLSSLARQRVHGKPGSTDPPELRKALAAIARLSEPPDLILLAKDSDGDEQHRAAMVRACESCSWADRIVLAVAHREAEAWIVAAFTPANREERRRLEEAKQELGFDPVERPHMLTSGRRGEMRDAKRVLALLVEGDRRASVSGHHERCVTCLTEAPLKDLERRGRDTGLPEFIADVEARVIPLLETP